jgi:hypothetical protein
MIIAECIVFSTPGSVWKYRLVNPDQYRSYDLIFTGTGTGPPLPG